MQQILYSELESKRFDANIYRCKTTDFDENSLSEQIKKHNVDVLILRLPTSTKAEHYKLLNLPYPVLHADTLVYYKCDLSKTGNFPLRDDFSLVPVNKDSSEAIKNLIPIVFDGYQNHYFSNPLFDKSKIIDGIVEWGLSFFEDSKKICLLAQNDKKQIAAFICVNLDSNQKTGDLILAGVAPEFSNQGIYSFLIQQTLSFLTDNGYKEVLTSTQIQNVAVQKAWIKSGLSLAYSIDTYHINSKLGNWASK
jgi:ribosomal protein S18 acetylase RimI-like enzyme